VCGGCYEVPEQMRSEVAAVVPEAYAETSWGTPAVDIGAGVVAQLRAADGLEAPVELVEVGRCTLEDDDLFSYRRQGSESGRLAGVVRVRS
jgi:copper oxidase (laccase) domain-containing protein